MKDRKVLKGFTLVELIVVMAIFSVIMLGAMQFFDPVNRMRKRASIEEANAAAVDNMKNYLEGSLRYADCIEVYVGSLTDKDGNEINSKQAAQIFVDNHFQNVPKEGSDKGEPLEGRVRVLKIDNADGGKVYETEYNFKAGCTYDVYKDGTFVEKKTVKSGIFDAVAEHQVINEAYYDNYDFTFIPGYNQIERLDKANAESYGFDTSYDNAETNYSYVIPSPVQVAKSDGTVDEIVYPDFTPSMFSLSVVTHEKENAVMSVTDSVVPDETVSVFRSPMALSNINLSLVNINTGYAKFRTARYGPLRWDGNKCPDGKEHVYGDMIKDDEGNVRFEKITNAAPFIRHSDAEGDCIYFVYSITEQK